jgi:hypothetical protein
MLGAAWPYRLWPPAAEAAVGVLCGFLWLRGLARPPDQAQCAEDRNLQDDQEKEDWPEPLHALSLEDRTAEQTVVRWAKIRERKSAHSKIRHAEICRLTARSCRPDESIALPN